MEDFKKKKMEESVKNILDNVFPRSLDPDIIRYAYLQGQSDLLELQMDELKQKVKHLEFEASLK